MFMNYDLWFMQNEPNFAGRSPARRAECAKQTQFGEGPWCKTNPISGYDGRGGAWGTRGQMRKTKPISPAGTGGTRSGGRGTRGVVQTNPIQPGRAGKPSPWEGRTYETKPIRPSRQAAASPESQNARNEPNSGRGARLPARPNAQNEPNFPPCRAGWGHRSERRGRDVRNKPNFDHGTWHGHPARESGPSAGCRCHCTEQSQFPPVRRTRWTRNPPLYVGRAPFHLSAAICFDFRHGQEYTMPSADESAEDGCRFID